MAEAQVWQVEQSSAPGKLAVSTSAAASLGCVTSHKGWNGVQVFTLCFSPQQFAPWTFEMRTVHAHGRQSEYGQHIRPCGAGPPSRFPRRPTPRRWSFPVPAATKEVCADLGPR